MKQVTDASEPRRRSIDQLLIVGKSNSFSFLSGDALRYRRLW